MKKILRLDTISCCGWCPHRYDFFDRRAKWKVDKYKCRKTKRVIRNINKISSWCPLEDYKE